MTLPIETLPDSTYLVGRRCEQMRNFLVPQKGEVNDEVANIFGYCIGYALKLHGLQIHGWVALLCQWYAVVTDPRARIPDFLREVHRLVGCCLRAKLKHDGHIWDLAKPTRLRADSAEEALQSLLEVMTLPLEETIVPSTARWFRRVTLPSDVGVKMTFKRPAYFFSESGNMPESVTLEITPLPDWADRDRDAYVEMLTTRVAEREAALREQLKREKRTFMSPRRLAAIRPHHRHRCTSKHTPPAERLAYMNKYKRRQAAKRRPEFLSQYRDAYAAWSSGADHNAIFPAGTYALSRYACVRVEPIPRQRAAA